MGMMVAVSPFSLFGVELAAAAAAAAADAAAAPDDDETGIGAAAC